MVDRERLMSAKQSGTATRHEGILAQLARQQRVHVSDLAARFDVSEETIRRDLVALEHSGDAVRVHGGAIVPTAAVEPGQVRPAVDDDGVVGAVLGMLPASGSIYLASGPVSHAVAEALPDAADRTLITSSIEIALLAAIKPATVVYNLGGRVRGDVRSGDAQFGPWTNELLAELRIGTAVIEVGVMGQDGAVLAQTPQQAEQVEQALEIAERRVLVITGRGGEPGLAVAAGLADFDDIVSVAQLPRDLAARAAEAEIRVVVPEAAA
ncbi:DeoR/GlpR family DNA-binding transcription regulator [Microbacterium sp. JB110]|uniref:DeoR/GlpR family DNA-binding transcription regulator n=1 Tax=Microbacterium sp. JB110 TaxID=2024477 RepID=UPI001120375B|nr:DeoR/GlpR family DNA-binding transcription regulator [Microbacterium sp. JB110]